LFPLSGKQALFCSREYSRLCIRLRSWGKLQAPIIAPHDASWWIFEVAFADKRKAQLAANCVRGRIVYRWKGMDRFVFLLSTATGDDFCYGCRGNTFSLKSRQNAPADLVYGFALPNAVPITDTANGDSFWQQEDTKHTPVLFSRGVDISSVPGDNLFLRLRTSQVLCHLRGIQELQQGEICFRPRLNLDLKCV